MQQRGRVQTYVVVKVAAQRAEAIGDNAAQDHERKVGRDDAEGGLLAGCQARHAPTARLVRRAVPVSVQLSASPSVGRSQAGRTDARGGEEREEPLLDEAAVVQAHGDVEARDSDDADGYDHGDGLHGAHGGRRTRTHPCKGAKTAAEVGWRR